MSIATEISRLQTAKANIKQAIEAKGVSVPSSALVSAYPQYISQIEGGGGGGGDTSDHTVFFYDYDGELVYSYSKADFLALSEYPANPTHTGLTAQGWNWSLADAKAYVTKYDYLVIGQHYVTTDGNTKVYITLSDPAYLDFRVAISKCTKVGALIGVDWGDSSPIEYFNVARTNFDYEMSHTYASTGDYVIQIIPEAGDTDTTFGIGTSSSYPSLCGYWYDRVQRENLNSITKVEFGRNVVYCSSIGAYNLETITMPKSLTEINTFIIALVANSPKGKLKAFISSYDAQLQSLSLGYLANLKCISFAPTTKTLNSPNASVSDYTEIEYLTLPEGWTYANNVMIGRFSYNLKAVVIPDNAVTLGSSSFNGCTNLKEIVLPSSLTTIGDSCFCYCDKLESIKLTGVTTINSSAFRVCKKLKSVSLGSSLVTLRSYAFESCISLEEIVIPNTVTTLEYYAFGNCAELKRVTLPNTITSLPSQLFISCRSLDGVTIPSTVTSIGNCAFQWCYALKNITIPSGVTSLGTGVFQWCLSLESITVLATTPPTLGSNGIDTSLKDKDGFRIYVPSGSVSAYQTATNWSAFADCIVEIED